MDNLLISTKIGTIFLDNKMCVRKFTPTITQEMDVDVGRPLRNISHKFNEQSFVSDAEKVMNDSGVIENEIETVDGRWYFLLNLLW